MDAGPFRSRNSHNFLLYLDAIVDSLRQLRGPHGRRLIFERQKAIMEFGREKIGNGFRTSLYSRPARFLLAPLGNVRDTMRWPGDVIVHHARHDSDGILQYGINHLRIPDAQKIDALLSSLRDLSQHRQRVGHDVCAIPAVVPRLRRNDALGGTEDQSARGGSLEIELVEGVGRFFPFAADSCVSEQSLSILMKHPVPMPP